MSMKLNKSKCGIMFVNRSRKQLAKWEIDMEKILDIPIVE